jgi:hypothetical protein
LTFLKSTWMGFISLKEIPFRRTLLVRTCSCSALAVLALGKQIIRKRVLLGITIASFRVVENQQIIMTNHHQSRTFYLDSTSTTCTCTLSRERNIPHIRTLSPQRCSRRWRDSSLCGSRKVALKCERGLTDWIPSACMVPSWWFRIARKDDGGHHQAGHLLSLNN